MKLKFVLIAAIHSVCLIQPVLAAPAAGQQPVSQSVFVVNQDEAPASAAGVQIDTPSFSEPEHKKPTRELTVADVWSGPVPVHGIAWLLIASMPVLASLYFAYQIVVFFRNRRKRLTVRHLHE